MTDVPDLLRDVEYNIQDILSLDLEYKLTVAYRIDCECAPYFIQRREVLLPEILKKAKEEGTDPVEVFAAFACNVHTRHTKQGQTLDPID